MGKDHLRTHPLDSGEPPADNGDNSMVFNSYQNIKLWQEYFGTPEGDRLGLLGALYQIGSVCSIPLVPFITDNYGRRLSIAIGFLIIIVGGILQGACQDYGSEFATRPLLPLRAASLTSIPPQPSLAAVSFSVSETRSPRSPRPCS